MAGSVELHRVLAGGDLHPWEREMFNLIGQKYYVLLYLPGEKGQLSSFTEAECKPDDIPQVMVSHMERHKEGLSPDPEGTILYTEDLQTERKFIVCIAADGGVISVPEDMVLEFFTYTE